MKYLHYYPPTSNVPPGFHSKQGNHVIGTNLVLFELNFLKPTTVPKKRAKFKKKPIAIYGLEEKKEQ